jgi:hypothetical protein
MFNALLSWFDVLCLSARKKATVVVARNWLSIYGASKPAGSVPKRPGA